MSYAQPQAPFEHPQSSSRNLDPHHFGPLSDQPVMNTGTHELFPGEDRFLSKSARKNTKLLHEAVSAHLDRCLAEDERVLHIAAAMQMPTLMEQIGMGWWFYRLHRVTLVLTDRRLIEILMDLKGKRPATRIRSYGWGGLSKIKFGFGKLKLVPEGSKASSWKILKRGDRKLLKALVPKIEDHAPQLRGNVEQGGYRWLCPECGTSNKPEPSECLHCRTRFRSPGLATLAALAFPGGGLFYAGRPVLGTVDLLGELFLFWMVALGLASSPGWTAAAPVMFVGVMFFGLTKLESVHLSRILVRRSVPESDGRRAGWRKGVAVGGTVSAMAVAGALLATGSLVVPLQNELTFLFQDGVWEESRDPAEFIAEDPSQRSQWTHLDGTTVFVSAYPMGPGETWEIFQRDYRASFQSQGMEPTISNQTIPEGFTGFRSLIPIEDEQGASFVSLNYFLWDPDSRAVHHAYAFAPMENQESVSAVFADLVSMAAWAQPTAP